ncbi:STAS domain-containing protein [Streptomyces sp. NPDC051815]|uniref:STAS domain-containing protein n=1 Tax=Streptomyces sp. NPDC051815 TaxID=3365674 RepID=UPI003798B857
MQPHPRSLRAPRTGPWQPPTRLPIRADEAEAAQAETESEKQAGYTLIHVRGELDLDTIHVLAEALSATDGPVVVDLGRVTFADTALVHALLAALPHHDLTLTGTLTPQVHRLLDVTGTRDRFALTPAA